MDTFKKIDISAAALHVLAMILMLMDHLWATLFPSLDWLTCAGRIAFPIFAFMSVEGYFHTHNFNESSSKKILLIHLLDELLINSIFPHK